MTKIFSIILSTALSAVLFNVSAQPKKPVTHIGTPTNGPVQGLSGKAVYAKYCVSCHQADGLGVQKMNPPLSKTSWIEGDKSRIIKVVLNGLSATEIDDETYNNVMASFDFLSDRDIANVLTYVRSSFGNKASAVLPEEVSKLRTKKK
ncbi:c-type cytochrome [Mucilaginibacter ginkgonis]|uniref:Cytochrome c n=1 Tax=Mucilaginibacter ginkgonis TaxID=2682091 RepID=A0A6I4I0N7_9SPHI|nr:cytochrome c [Mucilaginibacter ginkgonis]QQL51128.1 cytochrome c [Mucilaginibacter ginkgonis]